LPSGHKVTKKTNWFPLCRYGAKGAHKNKECRSKNSEVRIQSVVADKSKKSKVKREK